MKERIKEIRKHFDLNQEEFGERIGVKRSTITNYEIGAREPIEAVVTAICREFGVNRVWLETGEGEMLVERSRDEELSRFFGGLLKGDPSFKLRLISALSRCSEDEWLLIEKMALRLMDEMKNADPD